MHKSAHKDTVTPAGQIRNQITLGDYYRDKGYIEGSNPSWVGCQDCDIVFQCHGGNTRCIRLPKVEKAHYEEQS